MSLKDEAVRAHARNGHAVIEPPAGFELPSGPVDLRDYGVEAQVNGFTSAAREIAAPVRNSRVASASDLKNYSPTNGGQIQANAEQPRFEIKAIRFNELDQAEITVEYLIPGLLVRGQPGGIFGGKKALKTNISIDLILSLAIGGRFLGQFQVSEAVRAAMLSGESGAGTIQETARRIAMSKGRTLRDFNNAFIGFELPNLGDATQLAAVERFITERELQVLIIDPAYLCMPIRESASNIFITGPMLKGLSDIGQRTGCTMLINHHCKQGVADPFAPPELDSIAWSGFQEWVRQWFLIGRRAKYDPDCGGSHQLWLNAGGSAGHSALWAVDIEEGTPQDSGGRRWDVDLSTASQARSESAETIADEREAAKEAKQEAQARRDREKLLAAADQFPDGETKSRLKDKAKIPSARFNEALSDLMESAEIEACEVTKNGRIEPAYKRGQERSVTVGNGGLF
jgi:hypothetical protein